MMEQAKKTSDSPTLTCGCLILMMIFNLIAGGWSVNFLLDFFVQKTLPFIATGLIGLIVAEISLLVAIVIYILQFFGVL